MATRKTNVSKKEAEKAALAARLKALESPAKPSGKSFYADFDDYVKDYPEGEHFRAWLTNRGRNRVVLLLLRDVNGAMHSGLPGHYISATMSESIAWPDKTKKVVQLSLRDSDDGLAVRRWPAEQREEAERILTEMMALAPFNMREGADYFGLKFE